MTSHLLTFQPRFADLVASGAKRQTIRRLRAWGMGDTLHLWEGGRTHKVRKLGVARICWFGAVRIEDCSVLIRDAGTPWRPIEAEDLTPFAWADGFQTAVEFFSFFRERYGLPFEGVLIRWESKP